MALPLVKETPNRTRFPRQFDWKSMSQAEVESSLQSMRPSLQIRELKSKHFRVLQFDQQPNRLLRTF